VIDPELVVTVESHPPRTTSKIVIKSRLVTPKVLSIEGLNSRRTRQVFIGDIMVVYSTYLDKANKSRSIMRADMTGKEAMMTITLTIPTQLVHKHVEKILSGNGISIKNFNILPKTIYDRGNCDRIISLIETSIVEKILVVCLEYRFVSDATISQLAQSKDIYPIETIGAAITLVRKLG
jgi:hypothetical protein